MNLNLSDYKLVQPSSIKKIKSNKKMYDLVLEENHTFFVFLDDNNIVLSHNCDGHHIAALLINFFHKWFPHVIEDGRLLKLVTPLVVCDFNNKRKYFYSLEDFNIFTKENKVTNVNYLKGLGSLSIDDWKYVMTNRSMFQILNDRSSDKYLEIVFGDFPDKRKTWLERG